MYAVHPRHQTASQYTDGEDWGHTEDWGHIHTQTLTANRGHPRHQTASQYTDGEDWGHTEFTEFTDASMSPKMMLA